MSLLRPSDRDATMAQARAIAHSVHLDDIVETPVSILSHGQQRQLEIALALSGAPRFILFDEPAAGLSPSERRDLVAILNALPAYIGYIIIEHDLDVALRVSTYVTMMHNGRIFREGTPEAIEADAQVQAIYLGAGHG
jgi:branched-chain amino acid transport system ATP-binding protein